MSVRATASPAAVRAFAAEQGLTVGSRGRFAPEVVKAYNKANPKRPYKVGQFKAVELVTAKREGKTPVRANVNIAEARALLAANGVQVGSRGRLSQAQKEQAVLLKRGE